MNSTTPKDVYNLSHVAGEVAEIRGIGGLHGRNQAWKGSCFGAQGVVSGYFNSSEVKCYVG